MTSDQHMRTGRRVGEIAAATGLTVRTLHYYEEIGLLVPSGRSPAGHRLYDEADLARLYRICALRRLGLPLVQVAGALDEPAWDLHRVISAQVAQVDRRLEGEGRLRSRLVRLLASAAEENRPEVDDLLALLEEMTMLESNVTRRINLLVYADLESAYEYLVRVFGLGPGELTRDGEGKVVHGEIEAGDGVVWLHPESPEFGLASPRTLGGATACMAVMVDDVDAHHRRAVEQGAHDPLRTRRPAVRLPGVRRARQRGRHLVLHEAARGLSAPAQGLRGACPAPSRGGAAQMRPGVTR
jgi:DNA-binding transcriptional MerR regulator